MCWSELMVSLAMRQRACSVSLTSSNRRTTGALGAVLADRIPEPAHPGGDQVVAQHVSGQPALKSAGDLPYDRLVLGEQLGRKRRRRFRCRSLARRPRHHVVHAALGDLAVTVEAGSRHWAEPRIPASAPDVPFTDPV